MSAYGVWLRTKRAMARKIPDPRYGYVGKEALDRYASNMWRDVNEWVASGMCVDRPDLRYWVDSYLMDLDDRRRRR